MSHYFEAVPGTPSDRKVVSYRCAGMNFEFITDTSVFSRGDVDKGTDLLINTVIDDIKKKGASKGEALLDLGCGWGVVGVVMQSVFMSFDVTMTDINTRAVELSKENAELNRVRPKKIVSGNALDAIGEDERFDTVMTNPPVRAGKDVVFSFYEGAFAHMKEGGAIYVVLQRKQGAPSTEKKLRELFGNCETLSISGGYRVMRSIKEKEIT